MADINAFYPLTPNKNTVNLTPSNVSGNVALPPRNGEATIRIYNGANVTVFIAFGADSTITASASTDMPIPPGIVEIDRIPPAINYVAGITAGGSAGNIYFTPGRGV